MWKIAEQIESSLTSSTRLTCSSSSTKNDSLDDSSFFKVLSTKSSSLKSSHVQEIRDELDGAKNSKLYDLSGPKKYDLSGPKKTWNDNSDGELDNKSRKRSYTDLSAVDLDDNTVMTPKLKAFDIPSKKKNSKPKLDLDLAHHRKTYDIGIDITKEDLGEVCQGMNKLLSSV